MMGRKRGRRKKPKMSYTNQKKIVEMYHGIMTEEEIYAEFGIPPSVQKRAKAALDPKDKIPRHMCWFCKKATNMYLCKYVRSCLNGMEMFHYEGTKLSPSGKINYCPEYIEG